MSTSGSRSMNKIEKAFNIQRKEQLDAEITGCYMPPRYNALRTTLLQREKANVHRLLALIHVKWSEKGYCKATSQIIEGFYPAIVWTPCVIHTLNLTPKNICAAANTENNHLTYKECNWITDVAGDVSQIKNFIMNHGPKTWWLLHGSHAPLLQSIALKLLMQPSSSCAERNWSTYSFVHSVSRNKMTPQRAKDLVFIHSNLRLLSRKSNIYLRGESKMWDIAGDSFDFLEGVWLLEVANLSLDEPKLETTIFNDNEEVEVMLKKQKKLRRLHLMML
ncbi:hypothetical protein EZV62_024317 [Acer yangbiense]|uniref:HAT C-terminal dimerisation domain-containing protein n=1 Tax=Acer yangbiense TaxID=1000413 RepID=A0A5C7H460_9ROSI|nr:hypothetical protein EZV62_024317 [Acer yangbiense]